MLCVLGKKYSTPFFNIEDIRFSSWRNQTAEDVTDDSNGSVPCNFGDGTFEHPVYGVSKKDFEKTAPCLTNSVDVMAVGNLPNELPKDASRYFGGQLIKYVLGELLEGHHPLIEKATIVSQGKLTEDFLYMKNYAEQPLLQS